MVVQQKIERLTAPTIYAPATALGGSALAIIRVSGAGSQALASDFVDRELISRRATRVELSDADGEAIDDALLILFRAPASFTGEDVLELHVHGASVIVELVLRTCQQRLDRLGYAARMARPGEFSERAYHNQRLDLAQAEAIDDLVKAGSQRASQLALRTLKGEFSKQVGMLIESLRELRVRIESAIDFSDEIDQASLNQGTQSALAAIIAGLDALIDSARFGNVYRDGLSVVVLGRPNVGKSSLLNAMVGRDLAIVSSEPGTTRDPIQTDFVLQGVPIRLIDCAGIRQSNNAIENEGIQRSISHAKAADVVVMVGEAPLGWVAADAAALSKVGSNHARVVRVLNKVDQTDPGPLNREDGTLLVSALTGEGLGALSHAVVGDIDAPPAESVFLVQQRHLESMRRGREELHQAIQQSGSDPTLFAQHLQLAQMKLAQITGEYGVEDLLGDIFSRFCIGK